jgi:hypothetical protein
LPFFYSWVLNEGAFCFLCHSFFFPLVARLVEWLGSIHQETGATQLLTVAAAAAGRVRDTRAANEPKKELLSRINIQHCASWVKPWAQRVHLCKN